MKIESNDNTLEASSKSNKKKYTKDNLPKKKWITDSKIKAKLDAHVGTSRGAHQMRELQNQKAMTTNPQLPETSLLKSDLQKNDPNDPVTGEKLKSLLSSGAFSFNPKERENLERILGRG